MTEAREHAWKLRQHLLVFRLEPGALGPKLQSMGRPSERDMVRAVLGRYGLTFAQEMGIDLINTPAPLFQWSCGAALLASGVPVLPAVRTIIAMRQAGITTAQRCAQAPRLDGLAAAAGVSPPAKARSVQKQLQCLALRVGESFRGDLTALRTLAEARPHSERAILLELDGLGGERGADIFSSETQHVWSELYANAAAAAAQLHLPAKPEALAKLVAREAFPKLATGLVRLALDDGFATVREYRPKDELRTSVWYPEQTLHSSSMLSSLLSR